MKTLLVTSQITYVPANYSDVFEELLSSCPEHLAGLVLLRNLSPGIVAQIPGLAWLGCRGMALHLGRNILELPLRRREKAFEAKGLPVLRARSMNEERIVEWVRREGIDLIVNLRTRCIYRTPILKAPRLGCVNVHHGLLPENRGTLCDLYALDEGRPAGFTVHVMNERIDAGRILLTRPVSNASEKDYPRYLARTGREEGRILAGLLREIARTGVLPEGFANECSKPRYTRNPTRTQIRQMRRKGMIL
jgi:methionyl-tRNA formyltransferase